MSKRLCPTLLQKMEKERLICKNWRPNSLNFWVKIGLLTYILDSLKGSLDVFSLIGYLLLNLKALSLKERRMSKCNNY